MAGSSTLIKSKVVYAWVLACALIVLLGDQLMKWWIVTHMVEGQSINILGSFVRWYFIKNSGAAFSIGEHMTIVFTLVMIAAAIAILVFAKRVRSLGWAIGLGLILGGALGNLGDRLFRSPGMGFGHVVDFISVPHFAIFNIADSAVTCGVVLIVLLTLFGKTYNGRKSGTAPGHDGEAGSDALPEVPQMPTRRGERAERGEQHGR